MKELQTILKESERLTAQDAKAVLATVVDVQGSGYRLPGARMLITEIGETFGTVSGGCLESDVLERAKKVWQKNEPTVLIYDTTGKADSVFSLNMGCNGIVRILLEPVKDNRLFDFVKTCFETRKSAVVASLISSTNEERFPVGKRFYFNEADAGLQAYDSEIERELSADAEEIFAGKRSQCKAYEIDGETVEFFLEIIRPPINLMLFGAGYDAIPVAKFAKDLGWLVDLIDHRPAFATDERFPVADKISILRPETLSENVRVDENSVAVIMTHNYSHDREILKFLLSQPFAYIGALGPKRRTENLLQELSDEGVEFSSEQLRKLHAPIGLDIGAANPETIALSIIAEIQSVLAGRCGGFLRVRQGSIYDHNSAKTL